MKNKFLSVCFGVSLILLSTAFLVQSFSTAQAAPSPKNFLAEGTSSIGKYMITFQLTNGDYPNAIVWNTETGVSTLYAWGMKGWEKSQFQLPKATE